MADSYRYKSVHIKGDIFPIKREAMIALFKWLDTGTNILGIYSMTTPALKTVFLLTNDKWPECEGQREPELHVTIKEAPGGFKVAYV